MITMTIVATIFLRSKNRAILTIEVAEIIEDEAKIEVEEVRIEVEDVEEAKDKTKEAKDKTKEAEVIEEKQRKIANFKNKG